MKINKFFVIIIEQLENIYIPIYKLLVTQKTFLDNIYNLILSTFRP